MIDILKERGKNKEPVYLTRNCNRIKEAEVHIDNKNVVEIDIDSPASASVADFSFGSALACSINSVMRESMLELNKKVVKKVVEGKDFKKDLEKAFEKALKESLSTELPTDKPEGYLPLNYNKSDSYKLTQIIEYLVSHIAHYDQWVRLSGLETKALNKEIERLKSTQQSNSSNKSNLEYESPSINRLLNAESVLEKWLKEKQDVTLKNLHTQNKQLTQQLLEKETLIQQQQKEINELRQKVSQPELAVKQKKSLSNEPSCHSFFPKQPVVTSIGSCDTSPAQMNEVDRLKIQLQKQADTINKYKANFVRLKEKFDENKKSQKTLRDAASHLKEQNDQQLKRMQNMQKEFSLLTTILADLIKVRKEQQENWKGNLFNVDKKEFLLSNKLIEDIIVMLKETAEHNAETSYIKDTINKLIELKDKKNQLSTSQTATTSTVVDSEAEKCLVM